SRCIPYPAPPALHSFPTPTLFRSLKASAVARGILSPDAADGLSDHDAADLVFQSSVTTADAVTAISGRGLGMAIARNRIESLGRSEEHTSELQSRENLVCRLLLEK